MSEAEPSNPFKDRTFTVLNDIDQKVDKVKKKGIVFVGHSRVGKSTAYNWVIKHPLQAKLEEIVRQTAQRRRQVVNNPNPGRRRRRSGEAEVPEIAQKPPITTAVTYVPKTIRTETGQVRSGIKSCTLVPNIFDLSEQLSILDMAGYGDSRDYVGTLGVSYGLKAVFEVLEQVKFIVVITESILKNTKQLCETLNYFFGMFNLEKYPNIQDKIFDATSLLITHSVDYQKYYDLIKQAQMQLDDPELKNIQNRELIADFLYHISKKVNRFHEFKMAQLGNPTEVCNILEEFDQKGWKYFNLKTTREEEIKNIEDPDIINLPFQKEYLNLKPEEQTMLTNGIDKRLKSYRKFSQIFAHLFEEIFVQGAIHDIKLPYEKFFDKVKTFIYENDHYDSEKYITSNSLLAPQFSKPQKETLFYMLLRIKNIVTFYDSVIGTSKKYLKPTMDLFRERIVQLIELVSVIFCRNKDDYKKMLQLRFILLRGIRQFYMLLHVSQQNVSSSVNEIHDNFQLIFPASNHDYWQKFLLAFKLKHEERIDFGPKNQQNVIENYLQTRENAYAIEILFKTHEQDILKFESELIDQYYQILRDVKLIHARHQFQKFQYRKCIIYLHEAITLQKHFQKNYIKRMGDELDQSPIDIMVKIMYTNQENIFDMLKQAFVRMKDYEIALQISKELHWVHSACEIYQLMLAENWKGDKERIEEYAKYCMDHGLTEKGRTLFHRLLEVEKPFARKKEILLKIQEYIDHPQHSKQVYLQFLNHYFIDLIDYKREALLNTIGQFFKEETHNIDRIIDITKEHFNIRVIRFESQEQQQILVKYLEERDNCEIFCAANGFRANYLNSGESHQKQQLSTIIIGNRLELKQLSIKLIEHLETVSKLSKASLKGKQLKIDIGQIDSLGISEKHIIITLDRQQIKSTFEYAVKLMKAIKKLIYQPHHKLLQVIRLARDSIVRANDEIREHLFDKYGESITRNEIDDIKSIIQKKRNETNQGIEAQFRKLYKEPRLVRSELNSIFDYIRHKNWTDLYSQVKDNMTLLDNSNTRDSDAEMENTRYYY